MESIHGKSNSSGCAESRVRSRPNKVAESRCSTWDTPATWNILREPPNELASSLIFSGKSSLVRFAFDESQDIATALLQCHDLRMANKRRIVDDQLYTHFITFSVYRRRRLLDNDHAKQILLGVVQ